MSAPEVRVGQLWQDNDKRYGGSRRRFLRVTGVDDARAICESWWDKPGSTSRTVRIRLDRFKPTTTGYRLIEDVAAAPAESPYAARIRWVWKGAAADYDRACLAGNAYNIARAGGRLSGIEELAAALGVTVGDAASPSAVGGERGDTPKGSDLGGAA